MELAAPSRTRLDGSRSLPSSRDRLLFCVHRCPEPRGSPSIHSEATIIGARSTLSDGRRADRPALRHRLDSALAPTDACSTAIQNPTPTSTTTEQEVLAVADGRISDLKEGLPDNAGNNEASSRNITLDNVVGNYY